MTPDLRATAARVAPDMAEGVYAALAGPSFETPAEIRMLATMGATLVGMSTACETIALRQLGVRVAGFSLVTNRAAGLGEPLSHEEVTAVGTAAATEVVGFLHGLRGRRRRPPGTSRIAWGVTDDQPGRAGGHDRPHVAASPRPPRPRWSTLCEEAVELGTATVCVSPTPGGDGRGGRRRPGRGGHGDRVPVGCPPTRDQGRGGPAGGGRGSRRARHGDRPGRGQERGLAGGGRRRRRRAPRDARAC